MAKGRFNGGGMPGNMNNMMKQIKKMQKEMTEAQESLEQKVYEASAGGGAVKATVSGEKRLSAIEFSPDAVDVDDMEMLSDMIIAAVNEALTKAEEDAVQSMSKFTAGLNMPGMPGLF